MRESTLGDAGRPDRDESVVVKGTVCIPVVAWRREFTWVAGLATVVLIEVTILGMNKMSCPLTAVAARYTEDRRANFDIYLPHWLAAYNKQVFGALFMAGLLFALFRWIAR